MCACVRACLLSVYRHKTLQRYVGGDCRGDSWRANPGVHPRFVHPRVCVSVCVVEKKCPSVCVCERLLPKHFPICAASVSLHMCVHRSDARFREEAESCVS